MTDDPLTTCPKCEGPIHRVLFPASVVFKGSGFYSTDHRPSHVTSEPAEPASDGAKTDGVAAKPESGGGTSESATLAPSAPAEAPKATPPAAK